MDYPGVLNLIGNDPAVSPYLFETFVFRLLQRVVSGQVRESAPGEGLIHSPVDYGFDALAPKGIEGLEGPVAVIIKLKGSFSEASIRKEVQKIRSRAAIHDVKGALLVFSGRMAKSQVSVAEAEREIRQTLFPVVVWDYDRLSRLVDENQEFVSELVPRLSMAHLETISSGQSSGTLDDWKARRDRHVEALRAQYRENSLAVFLGAGVSFAAGVPTWNQLLNDLFAELVARQMSLADAVEPKALGEIVARFVDLNAPSPLVAGRYIRKVLANDFIGRLSKLLYRNLQPSRRGELDVLDSVARLCIPKRTGPGIRAVVTYNFDDLFEERLKEIHVPYHVVFRPNDDPLRDELPVYHVHGFLPRRRDEYVGVADGLVVFSEEGYHSLYRDPYFWANFVQLSLLKEASCLMVGLSLTDPNLRRLLEIASPQHNSPRHYAFLQRLSYERFSMDEGQMVVRSPRHVVEAFLNSHHQTEERLYQELGIGVVWVEEFSEVSAILARIRSA